MTHRHEAESFWSTIPTRGRVVFFTGIFCLFAPGMALPFRPGAAGWLALATMLAASGLIGALWAAAFTRRWAYAAAAVALQLFTAAGFGRLLPEWLWPPSVRFDGLGAVSFALVVLGYVLFAIFIRTEGQRSVRERTELRLARDIHGQLVPTVRASHAACEVYARSLPSSEVGGDLVDVIAGDGAVDLYLGDVSGHGVRSGVVMAMTKAAVHTARADGENTSQTLRRVSDVLERLTDSGTFVTFAALRVHTGGRTEYALAGHLPIFWWHAATRRITRLENEALPLGVVPGTDFPVGEIQAQAGDVLLLFTDGLIEVADPAGRQLGLDGFERLVIEAADMPLEAMFETLVKRVSEQGPALDDRTMLLVRIAGTPAANAE